ncbi:MAG: tetratricopeptide repeat protein [Acidobacteria bacterium]|nr:tetratricopeptide repeat protein [Acidobacteriota bacterium]
MASDTPRILELRRRVLSDPSSIAFAQLGEELRRAGVHEEAIEVCRAGLARHPAYLSARVTLGRALLELDRLDEAREELTVVVDSASDNLAAIRGLAEIHQRRGEIGEALGYYRRALELARHDPDLEETVVRMEKALAPPAPAEEPVSVEALFDFDRLVEQLGAETPPGVQALDAFVHELEEGVPLSALAGRLAVPPVGGSPDAAADPLANLEGHLRSHTPDPDGPGPADKAALAELEGWLDVLRQPRP